MKIVFLDAATIGNDMTYETFYDMGEVVVHQTTNEEEFEEHAVDKKCRTQECKALAKITIDPDKCKGCGLCQRSCPVEAIKED